MGQGQLHLNEAIVVQNQPTSCSLPCAKLSLSYLLPRTLLVQVQSHRLVRYDLDAAVRLAVQRLHTPGRCQANGTDPKALQHQTNERRGIRLLSCPRRACESLQQLPSQLTPVPSVTVRLNTLTCDPPMLTSRDDSAVQRMAWTPATFTSSSTSGSCSACMRWRFEGDAMLSCLTWLVAAANQNLHQANCFHIPHDHSLLLPPVEDDCQLHQTACNCSAHK